MRTKYVKRNRLMQCLYMLNKQWCSFCLNVVAAKHFYQFYISVVMNKNYLRLRDRRLQNWGTATFVIYFVINILDINKAMIWSFHDWCNKAVVRYPVWDDEYKRSLAANRKE